MLYSEALEDRNDASSIPSTNPSAWREKTLAVGVCVLAEIFSPLPSSCSTYAYLYHLSFVQTYHLSLIFFPPVFIPLGLHFLF